MPDLSTTTEPRVNPSRTKGFTLIELVIVIVILGIAVLFSTSEVDLETRFTDIAERLTSAGGLWVAWPKKASGMLTDLDSSIVRAFGLDQQCRGELH